VSHPEQHPERFHVITLRSSVSLAQGSRSVTGAGYRSSVGTGGGRGRATGAAPSVVALRRLVLAVSVLQDLDLMPGDDGVEMPSGRVVSWDAIAAALGNLDPDEAAARPVLARWLRELSWLSWRSPDDLSQRARPVGLPRGHVLHPGSDWVRRAVHGRALDIGVGFVGIGPDPDEVVVPRAGLMQAVGCDPRLWWPACRSYLEDMGMLAASRHEMHPDRPIHPMGDCDVVTLLGSRAFRTTLAGKDSARMRAAAVPTRRRGWLDLSRTDPAFALAAASLADPEERGFERPLLITVDEVALARSGGDPVLQAIRDGAAPDPVLPSVRYR